MKMHGARVDAEINSNLRARACLHALVYDFVVILRHYAESARYWSTPNYSMFCVTKIKGLGGTKTCSIKLILWLLLLLVINLYIDNIYT